MKKIAVLLLLVSSLGFGVGFRVPSFRCFKPSEPICLSYEFDSESDFRSCKLDLNRYIEELQQWAVCVYNEALAEARNDVDEAIDKFNCRAKGERICF